MVSVVLVVFILFSLTSSANCASLKNKSMHSFDLDFNTLSDNEFDDEDSNAMCQPNPRSHDENPDITHGSNAKPRIRPRCSTDINGLLHGLEIGESPNFDGTNELSLLPPWVNISLAIKGQQFSIEHVLNVGLSHFYGLAMLLSFPQISHILHYTGKSETPKKSARRYATTMIHVFLWIRRAISSDKEFNWVLKSFANVRRIHQNISFKIKASYNRNHTTVGVDGTNFHCNEGMWNAFEKDLNASNVVKDWREILGKVPRPLDLRPGVGEQPEPMNQFAFAMTQWAFMGITIMKPKSVLLYNIPDGDLIAFAHFWAVIGYAMGLEDEFNIALQPDVNTLKNYMEQVYQNYFLPKLLNLRDDGIGKSLIESLLIGATEIIPILEPEWLLRGLLRDVMGIPTPNLDSRRTLRGIKLDALVTTGKFKAELLPNLESFVYPLASMIHFPIGIHYYGNLYASDEHIAKYCYYH